RFQMVAVLPTAKSARVTRSQFRKKCEPITPGITASEKATALQPAVVRRVAPKTAKRRASRQASKRQTTEDKFSWLPTDCLLDIATRLDQEDLDELETTSAKMNAISARVRAKARKLMAEEMVIFSDNPRAFRVTLRYSATSENLNFEKEFTDETSAHGRCRTCRNQTQSSKTEVSIASLHKAFMFARAALGRREFGIVSINMTMDLDVYFDLCRTYINIRDTKLRLTFSLGNKLDVNVFIDWLLERKPTALGLKSDNFMKVVSYEFIEKYSKSVAKPALVLDRLREEYQGQIAVPDDRDVLTTLSKFSSLAAETIIVEPERFMALVMIRFHRKQKGWWVLQCTRPLDRATITDFLKPTMKSRLDERGFVIVHIDDVEIFSIHCWSGTTYEVEFY
ncbi:hypothetical protein PENTCL1PPCAC_21305, partial [Pristionchus entomophagus]